MQHLTRRHFLAGLGLTSAALGLAGCGGGSEAGADAQRGVDAGLDGATADAASACTRTRNDALGPFHQPGAPARMNLAEPNEPGDRMVLRGTVVAADCTTVLAKVLLDVWQADAQGDYHGGAADNYRLRGQVLTDADGRFEIATIRPGNYETSPGAWRPAHIHFLVSSPGRPTITTQVYFAGDPFLPPNDSCTTCTSGDADRVVPLVDDAVLGLVGEVRFVMG